MHSFSHSFRLFPALSLRSSWADTTFIGRYLQNGNILAARAFITHLVSQLAASRPDFISPIQSTPIPIGKPVSGTPDEIVFTTDSLVNFAQLAVRACQRSQGDKNKVMREAWIRLCGSYQSKGGLLAVKEVRKVRLNMEPVHSVLPTSTVAGNAHTRISGKERAARNPKVQRSSLGITETTFSMTMIPAVCAHAHRYSTNT